MPLPTDFILNFKEISVIHYEGSRDYTHGQLLKNIPSLKSLCAQLTIIKDDLNDSLPKEKIKELLDNSQITFGMITKVIKDTSNWLWSIEKYFLSESAMQLIVNLFALQELCCSTPKEKSTLDIHSAHILTRHFIYGLQSQLMSLRNPLRSAPQQDLPLGYPFENNQEAIEYFVKYFKKLQDELALVNKKSGTRTTDETNLFQIRLNIMQQWLIGFVATDELEVAITRKNALKIINETVNHWIELRKQLTNNVILSGLIDTAVKSLKKKLRHQKESPSHSDTPRPIISGNGTVKIEPKFICPLSYSIIKDPVELVKQHTNGSTSYRFDRPYLTAWLKNHDTNPLTHEKLTSASYKKSNGFNSSSFIQEVSVTERQEAYKNWRAQATAMRKVVTTSDIESVMINTQLKKYIMRAEKEIKEVWVSSFFCIPIPRKINQKLNCKIAQQLSAQIEKCLKEKNPINLAHIATTVVARHKNHLIRSSELKNIINKMQSQKSHVTIINSENPAIKSITLS